jgi:hypothetical protein
MWLDLVVSQLHITSVGDLVDCVLVFVGKLEHIVGGIPTSLDITWHHACIERKVVEDTKPLWESEGAGIFYCERKFAELWRS